MLKKLLTLYPNSYYQETEPAEVTEKTHYWFQEEGKSGFVGLPKEEITDREVALLSNLFASYLPPVTVQPFNEWYYFLYEQGACPTAAQQKQYRAIQLQCSGDGWEQKDIEQALRGFMSESVQIVWEGPQRAIMLEPESPSPLNEEDFIMLTEVLENDVYVRTQVYIGKFADVNEQFPNLFTMDRAYFGQALQLMKKERLFTFERIFPFIIASELPAPLLETIDQQLLKHLEGDIETLTTLKVYLENNLNASMTAKKLYIHRNTLQYRLDKFAEKTGVNVRDFSSAVTLYLACLIQEKRQQ